MRSTLNIGFYLGILLIVSGISAVGGADFAELKTKKNNIGISIGSATGMGLTYRRWFDSGYGVQVSALPMYHDYPDDPVWDGFYSIGGLKSFRIRPTRNYYWHGNLLVMRYSNAYADGTLAGTSLDIAGSAGAGIDFYKGYTSVNITAGWAFISRFPTAYSGLTIGFTFMVAF